MEERKLTGYPSIDRPWLRYYEDGAFERTQVLPDKKTLWNVLEEKLSENLSVPALEYFGKRISRKEFIKNVYMWARAFKQLGVREDEVVVIYGPFLPEFCYIACALNAIGATAYFLKLSLSKQSLAEETSEARIAIVFDGMWENVADIFSDDRFAKIIFITVFDSMPFIKKHVLRILGFLKRGKGRLLPPSEKCLNLFEIMQLANQFTGAVQAKYKPERNAFITSSSGTSINSVAKSAIATNESAISQLLQAYHAKVNYRKGAKCLANLPLTASTSLNCLLFLPLYYGMTVIAEPRLSESLFYRQIMEYKPQVAVTTGSLWEALFRELEKEIKDGKKVSLSFLEMPIIGGEGVTTDDLQWMNALMFQCGASVPMFSGYGLSEAFSVVSVDKLNATFGLEQSSDAVISVGIPYPGVIAGVFDDSGNELQYGQRGELWIQSRTVMKEYYLKEDLTSKTIIDGWLHTGDLFTIDENGLLYLWGRMDDRLVLPGGKAVYLFDIANKLRKEEVIKYAFVNAMPLADGTEALVAHVVFSDNTRVDQLDIYRKLHQRMKDYLPSGVTINGYKAHKTNFQSSPTTAKKDRHGLMKEYDGYILPTEKGALSVSFTPDGKIDCRALEQLPQ